MSFILLKAMRRASCVWQLKLGDGQESATIMLAAAVSSEPPKFSTTMETK
jgi:hypothetical protein